MYFGSVRFYKNLILLAVLIMIAVPSVAAFRLRASLAERESQVAGLEEELANTQQSLINTERQLASLNAGDGEDPAKAEAPKEPSTPEDALTPEMIHYQSLYPDFYAPEEYHATQRSPKTIYLTFDDGPSKNTSKVLKVLADHDVKATFFVIAQSDETGYQRMRDIVDQGHTLGMHSYCHEYNTVYQSVEAFLDDMYKIFTQIREVTGTTPTLFRFPGGTINSYNAGIYQELVAEMMRRGFVPCDWNMSGEDAVNGTHTPAQIVRNVMKTVDWVESGYVLLHDGDYASTTADALDTLIGELQDEGFRFDRLTPEIKPVLFGY